MRRKILIPWVYFEFFFLAVVFLVPMGLATLVSKDDPVRRLRGQWMRRFGRTTSRLNPLWKFRVEGETPAEAGGGAVVVSNHESIADPFLLSFLRWDMRWIAKEELFKLPLIGWLMQFGGDIPLRRGKGDSIRAMMEECRRTIEKGMPVMIFPEGTRSPDGRLLPFKDGAFRLAIETGVPIVPLALAGTRRCRPKGSMSFGEAHAIVRVLEPISTEGMTLDDVEKLKAQTRSRIAKAVAELQGKLGFPVVAEEGIEPVEVDSANGKERSSSEPVDDKPSAESGAVETLGGEAEDRAGRSEGLSSQGDPDGLARASV